MSDPLTQPYSFGLPEGRLLEDVERPKGFVISKFPQATPERIEAARKNVPEIPDERIDRSTDPWRDRETGETYELVREFFNMSILQRAARWHREHERRRALNAELVASKRKRDEAARLAAVENAVVRREVRQLRMPRALCHQH